jgi:tetratricopeptide (TPR) repeat protein
MAFQPQMKTGLVINGIEYTVMEHPQAPGVPYGQEGRQGTVYLLYAKEKRHKRAMKVFRSKLLNPSLVQDTQQITKFAGINGLSVCDRYILTPQNNQEVLNKEPDLLYAIMMPWIEGPTWMDVLLDKRRLTKRQSYSAAFALTEILVTMEQRGMAHCDLSGPNVMLPLLKEDNKDVKASSYVQLIDIEQMYAMAFNQPELIPGGSPGYAPKQKTKASMWSAQADRFAGAVLLMEMLASCSDSFFVNVWGESYFAPAELQSSGLRFEQLMEMVRVNWGSGITDLFIRAWESEELSQCPTFGEWMVELSRVDQAAMKEGSTAAPAQALQSGQALQAVSQELPVEAAKPMDMNKSGAMLNKAKALEAKGKYKDALDVYRSIRKQNPHSSIGKEIDIAIEDMEEKLRNKKKVRTPLNWGPALKFARKILTIACIIGGLGFGGYYGYPYVKDRFLGAAANAGKEKAPPLTSEEKADLLQSIAEKDKAIAQLNEQVKELTKPVAQRREELIHKLNENYLKIKDTAAMDPGQNQLVEKQTFEASSVYINHLFEFVRINYNLEPKFTSQFGIVGGYYYPYLYNENRNAQLNLQFFKSYKDQF